MKKCMISFILALSLLIPLLSPLSVLAKDESASPTTPETQTLPMTEETTAPAAPVEPDAVSEAELLADCAILKYVDAETFRAAGHVARLPELETMSSYAFRNADGTHTVYYLDHPVKYVDDDGDLQTIDLTLQADGAVYRPVSNDLSLTLAKDYTDGVTLSHNGLSATLLPITETEVPPLGNITETVMVIPRVSGETLTYENALDPDIDLRYTVLYNGVKGEIVLNSAPDESTFTFLLNPNGLSVFESNGQYYFAATADATERITLSSAVAYDTDADMCEGTMSVAAVQNTPLYEITVTVSNSWLQTDAEYPVSIDLTMLAEPYSSDAILDAPVYTLKPTQNFGSYTYNRVGYYSGWGIGRTVVRPDGMLNSALYQSLHASQVNSVLFTVTEATGSANQTIEVHKLYNGEGWTESNVTYDSMGFSRGVVTTAQLGNNQPTTFDLADLVKEWINGTNVASNGFMMKGVNENTVNKAFCSTEFGTTSMRPYMTLNYTPVTAEITPDDDFVKIGESVQFYCTTSPYNAEVTWTIRDSNIATVTEDGLVTGVSQGQTYLSVLWDGGSKTVTIKVGALEEGTYFIGNKQTGKYWDLESAASAEGTPIQQYFFHGMSWGRWIIAMESSGSYSIRSEYTGKYIGVEGSSTASGAAIKQYNLLANQKGRRWYISQTSSGAYRFTPGSSSSMAIAVPSSGASADGTDLVQLTYTNNSDYRDEWVVYSLDQQVNLDIMYDHAYLSRYPNAYNQLINQLVVLQQVYIENFGIFVNYDTPTIFSSYADSNCTPSHSSTCNHIELEQCTNSILYESGSIDYQIYHHNNIYNNLLRVPFPDLSSTTRMVFFGRQSCASIDGTHDSHPYYGLAYYNLGLISITNFDSLASELKTIVHEFGHLYFAPDHYDIGDIQSTSDIISSTGDFRFNENCIYGENKDDPDIIENLTICEGCKARIVSNSSRFSH